MRNNSAYIDGANLYLGIRSLGWEMDYARFRIWLRDKYRIDRTYIFIGYLSVNEQYYQYLREIGYEIVFKDIVRDKDGKVKGNCDADLVLKVVCDTYEDKFDQAVVISSDGDYYGLVNFLKRRNKILCLLSHDEKKCSILLKRTGVRITYLKDYRLRLQKEKAPNEDVTSQGSLS